MSTDTNQKETLNILKLEELVRKLSPVLENARVYKSPRLRKVRDAIQSTYPDPVTLEQASTLVKLNTGQLDSLFVERTGYGYDTYHTTYSIARAVEKIIPFLSIGALDSDLKLQRAKNYVMSNLNNGISLEATARAAAKERTYFSTIFHEKANVTFRDWVRHIKIGYALQIMSERDYSIKEIADKTGYNDLRTFERKFKDVVGIAPREFKRYVVPIIVNGNTEHYSYSDKKGTRDMIINHGAINYFAQLQRVKQYVEKNYSKLISLDIIAGIACMEASYFSTFFHEKVGITFPDYLRFYRISKAKEIFKTSDKSVTEVAFEVGFSDLRTFERNFKGIEGMTPVKYQQTIRPCLERIA